MKRKQLIKQFVVLVLISGIMSSCIPRKPLRPPPRPHVFNEIFGKTDLA